MSGESLRSQFFAIYGGLLKGLNLVQQKGWDPKELQHFFPESKSIWLPYLESRHEKSSQEAPLDLIRELHLMLHRWDDAAERTLLERRLHIILCYIREANKRFCDQETLSFFLEGQKLVQLAPSSTIRPFTTSSALMSSLEAKDYLEKELERLFPEHAVTVKLSEKTLARASTGKLSIRLREDHAYTREELAQLTVHEAWVHLGTNLQGTLQHEFPWLAHWHPSVTAFQEGLALIAEIVGGCWTEKRQAQVIHRHQAALLALRGWNARHIHQWLMEKGLSNESAMAMVLRVFRGCSLEGGMAFGKELLYVVGLQRWCQLAPQISSEDMRVALCGKMSFTEWDILRTRWKSRLILPKAPGPLLDWMKNYQISQLQFLHIPAA